MTTDGDPAVSEAEGALARALDHHWLAQTIETGIAYCTCGQWSFDAKSGQHPLPVLGEKFLPFSEHVAQASLAALSADGWRVEREDGIQRALTELEVMAMLPVYVPPKPEDEEDRYLLRGAVLELVRRATAALRGGPDATD